MLTEKQLVDLFLSHDVHLFVNPFFQKHRSRKHVSLNLKREFTLQSNKRCDLVIYSKNNRLSWIIEFKVYADVQTVAQLISYFDEYLDDEVGYINRGFSCVHLTIAAQYFTDDCINLSNKLGITLIHLQPVNSKKLSYELFGNGSSFNRSTIISKFKNLQQWTFCDV